MFENNGLILPNKYLTKLNLMRQWGRCVNFLKKTSSESIRTKLVGSFYHPYFSIWKTYVRSWLADQRKFSGKWTRLIKLFSNQNFIKTFSNEYLYNSSRYHSLPLKPWKPCRSLKIYTILKAFASSNLFCLSADKRNGTNTPRQICLKKPLKKTFSSESLIL